MASKFERQLVDLLSTMGDSATDTHPRLKSMSSMLKRVIEKAKTVQKGTDSQKKFSLQYTEFCQAVIASMPELESVARASFASLSSSSSSLSPVGFLVSIASCVSLGSGNTLAATYLENIGRSALHKAVAAAAKAEEKPTPAPTRTAKRGREDQLADLPSPTTASHTRKFSPKAVPSPVIVGSASPLLHSQHPMSHDPLPTFSLSAAASSSNSKFKSVPLVESGGASSKQTKKLSTRPGLASVMMPWTMPPPYSHGVAVDRAPIERAVSGLGASAITQIMPQRSVSKVGAESHGTDSTAARRRPGSDAALPTVLDICLAASGAEMLALWEEREAGLDSLMLQKTASSSRGAAGGVSPALMPQPVSATSELARHSAFFPHSSRTASHGAVPPSTISAMFHFGVVATEAPYLQKG